MCAFYIRYIKKKEGNNERGKKEEKRQKGEYFCGNG